MAFAHFIIEACVMAKLSFTEHFSLSLDHPRQPGTFGCFFNHQSNHPPSRIEALSDRIEASGPKDAEFRDRSASNVCPIATLRGPIL